MCQIAWTAQQRSRLGLSKVSLSMIVRLPLVMPNERRHCRVRPVFIDLLR